MTRVPRRRFLAAMGGTTAGALAFTWWYGNPALDPASAPDALDPPEEPGSYVDFDGWIVTPADKELIGTFQAPPPTPPR